MALVSIIIPTFNRARFLGAAIDSALAQGEGVEVIVVDDGSTDGSAAVLDYFGSRIRVMRQANQGPSAARNYGAAEARGEFLFFLDSDDLLVPGAIAALLGHARSLGKGKVPFGHARTIDGEGRAVSGPTYGYPLMPRETALLFPDLLGGIMPLCLGLVPRADFVEVGGLRTDMHLGEDHELAVRLHKGGARYIASAVPVVQVRLHEGPRLSGGANRDFGPRALHFWKLIADHSADEASFDRTSRSGLARAIWVSGRDSARGGDQPSADGLFALARQLDPEVDRASPWPLRRLGGLVGPYAAERCVDLIKRRLLGR